MRRVRWMSALGVGLSALAFAARIRAEPVARLDYARAPGAADCPDAAELERAVSRGLGENPFDPGAASTYRVRVLVEGGRLAGHVTLLDAAGNLEGGRRFESALDRCDELVAALALAISITINPDVDLEAPPAAPLEAQAEASDRPEQASKPAVAAPAAKRQRSEHASVARLSAESGARSGVELGLETHAALGPGPAPTGGFGVFGRLRTGVFSGALEGRYDAPVNRQLLQGDVHATLIGVNAVPCFHFGPAFACGVLLVANVTAASEGVSNEQSDSGLYFASGPRLGFGLEVGEKRNFRLEGHWDGLFALTPVSVMLNGESVWEGPPVSGALGAAAAWRVP